MRTHRLSLPAPRLVGAASSALLTALIAATATPSHAQSQAVQFAGAALDRPRAAQLARQGGVELIDFRACRDQFASCVQLAVREPGGEARVLQVSDRPCRDGNACFAGYAVTTRIASQRLTSEATASAPRASRKRGRPGSTASTAKVSGKPGKDGAPPDPQDEAQADATNEIIEALGDGKYEGDLDAFWSDLESIQTWDNPSWREPDHPPVSTDKVRVTGKANPGVLVSGRYETSNGSYECRNWVSYTSATGTIANIGNWVGNAPFDGCDSEVAAFSENGGALLDKPEGRWSKGQDDLDYATGATIKIPTSVWVIYAATDYATEEQRIKDDFSFANATLATSRCGIELQPAYYNKTTALADPGQTLGCGSIESTLKKVGFHPDRMNVYLVKSLAIEDRAGVACTKESDNVILLDPGRRESSLAHEYGHWFDLWHTNTTDMPLVNIRNVMSDNEKDLRNMLTAGQCYRANFSKDSYINKHELRKGKTKKCAHLQDADPQCPGLKNEFGGTR